MAKGEVDKLHSVLFAEGRELVNIKFLPGTNRGRGLTVQQVRDAAANAIASVLQAGPKDAPPHSGIKKASLKATV